MQQLNIITTLTELDAVRDEWEALYERAIIRSPLTTFAYIRMWYATFAASCAMRVYRVQVGDTLIGFMPLVLTKGEAGIRQLGNLVNDHCLVSYPLVAQGYEYQFQQELLSRLIASGSAWDVFVNDFSFDFAPLPGLFSDAQLAASRHRWHKNVAPTYAIRLPKTFAEYWNQIPSKNFKKSIKKPQNRLNKEKDVCFVRLQDAEAIAHWSQFLELEASGWKGAAGTAIAQTGAMTQQYYRDFLQILADTNNLYLYLLTVDGVLLSAVFGYFDGSIFQYFKIAYNEKFAQFSPSHVLCLHILEDLMTHYKHIEMFHMFPYDTGYKQKLINESTCYMTTTIHGRTVRGQLFFCACQLKELLKKKLPGVFVLAKKTAAKMAGKDN